MIFNKQVGSHEADYYWILLNTLILCTTLEKCLNNHRLQPDMVCFDMRTDRPGKHRLICVGFAARLDMKLIALLRVSAGKNVSRS